MPTNQTGTHICGWCITGHHDSCKVSVSWYDNVWYCGCDCPKTDRPTVPTVTTVAKVTTRKPKSSKRVTKAAQSVLDDALANPDVQKELDKWGDTPK